jgi:hypothetical protein
VELKLRSTDVIAHKFTFQKRMLRWPFDPTGTRYFLVSSVDVRDVYQIAGIAAATSSAHATKKLNGRQIRASEDICACMEKTCRERVL